VQKSKSLVQGWENAVEFFMKSDHEGLARVDIHAVEKKLAC
jgi:hypothetical protein